MKPALLAHFREQAGFCEAMGSPFTARLVAALGRDLEAGGPTAALVGDWGGSPRADVVSLRLAGALHAAALSGRDATLAALYPTAQPDAKPEAVWNAARDFLAREREWVANFLLSPPQTNEPRRSLALLAGFLDLAARFGPELEVLELGASAGLNLCWDRAAYRTDAWRWGAGAGPPIETEWRGPAPRVDAPLTVRARAACDQNPLDLRDRDERLRLRAYVWPDQSERLARFDAAVERALALGVRVERADAGAWIEARLAARPADALTVVYHSVFYQYPPHETRERIAAAIAGAGERGPAPLAWLRVEPEAALDGPRESVRFLVDVVTWPGAERRTLGVTDGHVRFVEWAA